MKVYRFFYETRPDSMPEYVYVSAHDYATAYRLFLGHLRVLQGFAPSGPLRFYDWSPKGQIDIVAKETDAPEGTVGGGGEFRRWKSAWM